MARFAFISVVRGKEQDSFPITVEGGYMIEAFGPRVSYRPILGVDAVRSGSGLRTYGAGLLTSVQYNLDIDWVGTVKLTAFFDTSDRRVLGASVSLTNPSGKVTVQNTTKPLWGLDGWGENYKNHGVILEFTGAGSGVLRDIGVTMTVQSFAATPQVVGDNFGG